MNSWALKLWSGQGLDSGQAVSSGENYPLIVHHKPRISSRLGIAAVISAL